MSVIGQAIIEVIGDAKKFPASVEEGVKPGLAAAEEETAVSGERMGTGLKGKFSSAFGGIGQVAKLAIGVGVAEAFKTGFEKVEGDQVAMARLQAGLKSTGDAAGITAKQGEDLASSVQNYSGQSKESIIDTEQLLLRFKNLKDVAGQGNQVFTQTTKIAADMAARLGGDASSQATKLGKALDDPIKGVSALTRVGVVFTDAQKAQITALVNSGNTMGAQKVILDQLTQKYGGSAQAVGETLPGKINIAKLSFEDLAGQLVGSMMPVFNTLISVVGVLLPIIGAVAPILAPLAIGVFAVVGAFKAWNAVQEAFNVIVKEGSLTTGGWITVIVLLATVLIAAYQHSKTFRDIVQGALHAVEAAINSLLGVVRDMEHVFEAVVGAIVGFVRDHWMLLVAILTGPIGLAVAFIVTHFNQILDTAQSVVNGVIGFFKNLVSFVTTLPGKIASAASGMWDGIKAAFREAIDWIIMGWNSLHFHVPGFSVGPIHFGGFDLGLPQIPLLATGGAFNGMAIVGEHGPELVRGAGTVYSRQDTEKMLGSGVTIHPGAFAIHIHGNADKKDVDTALRQWTAQLSTSLRRRGVVPA